MGSGHHEIRNMYNTHSYTRTRLEHGERNLCNNIYNTNADKKKNQMSSRKPKIMYNNMFSYAFSSTYTRQAHHLPHYTPSYTFYYLPNTIRCTNGLGVSVIPFRRRTLLSIMRSGRPVFSAVNDQNHNNMCSWQSYSTIHEWHNI
jgi:hypothetical protein